jgi:hypothetical protein
MKKFKNILSYILEFLAIAVFVAGSIIWRCIFGENAWEEFKAFISWYVLTENNIAIIVGVMTGVLTLMMCKYHYDKMKIL